MITKATTILDKLPGVAGFRDAVHCINDNHLLLMLKTGAAGMSDPNKDLQVRKAVWIDDEGMYRGLKSLFTPEFKSNTKLAPTHDIQKVKEFLNET